MRSLTILKNLAARYLVIAAFVLSLLSVVSCSSVKKSTALGKTPVEMQKGNDSERPGSLITSATIDEDQPLTQVSQKAEFKGGDPALFSYLNNNIHYPAVAQEAKMQGTVFVKFVVRKTGKISDVTVIRGIGKLCDDEAVRVIQNMPDWIPAQNEGKAVSFVMMCPITFKQRNSKTR